MKKISIILTILMLLSLLSVAACSKTEAEVPGAELPQDQAAETPPAGQTGDVPVGGDATDQGEDSAMTPEELAQTLPFEHVPEKLEAGMEVLVAGIMQNLSDQMIVDTQEGLKGALEELGFTYIYTSYDLDTSMQLTQMENYLTMGAALITTALSDVSLCTQYSEMCEAQGCYFTVNGSLPTDYISGASAVDMAYVGKLIAEMALEWVSQAHPNAGEGEIKVAQLGNIRNPEPMLNTETIYNIISADPRCEIVYKNDNAMGIDAAYTAAEEAMTANPNVRLFMCFNFAQATGVNNLVMSLPNVDPGEFGVFGWSYDQAALQLVEASKTDGSILRGLVISAAETTYEAMYNVITGLLLDGAATPYIIQEPLATVNSLGWELP